MGSCAVTVPFGSTCEKRTVSRLMGQGTLPGPAVPASRSGEWSARFRCSCRPGSAISTIILDEIRMDIAGSPLPNEAQNRRLIVEMTYLLSL